MPRRCHSTAWNNETPAESEAGGGADSTIARLGFEKSLKDARRLVNSAVVARAQFFSEMTEEVPHLGRLRAAANAFSHAAAAAGDAFAVCKGGSKLPLGGPAEQMNQAQRGGPAWLQVLDALQRPYRIPLC